MIGKSVPRVDAYEKVTGRAKFTDDLVPPRCLVAKVLHATIGNGIVKSIDTSEAVALEGVVKVVTFYDVPDHCYPTPGHPWSVELAHQDVADRNLLTGRVRYYGDDIAAVVAEDEIIASRALKKIKVEYEEYPVEIHPRKSMYGSKPPIHFDKKDNVLARSNYFIGDVDKGMEEAETVVKGTYKTPIVQHCHIENPISYAYMEKGRIVVVTSTQIPHIVRRVIGQALGIPWGNVRVIKPYIGGGFGNKQDVLYEPLNAFLTTQVGGRPVKLDISREETFWNTRTRHAIEFDLAAGVDKEGKLIAKDMHSYSNQGAYASHGHAIAANGLTSWRLQYACPNIRGEAYTIYTNTPVGGAMRGYGIPQVCFAIECFMDDVAEAIHMDPEKHLAVVDRSQCDDCLACTKICETSAMDVFGKYYSVKEIFDCIARDERYFGSDGGLTIGGGEATYFPDFTLELIRMCHDNYIHVALDTCGFIETENGRKCLEEADLVLFDLKGMDDAQHRINTGVSNQLIHKNLRYRDSLGKDTPCCGRKYPL